MLVCAFNNLPNGAYSNLFSVVAFPSKFFSGKISFPAKNSYSLTFLDDKAKISTVYLSKLY